MELGNIEDEHQRFNRLVELNVQEQVRNLAKTTIIQHAWQNGEYPHLHGWVFDLNTGLIKEFLNIDFPDQIDPIFRYSL